MTERGGQGVETRSQGTSCLQSAAEFISGSGWVRERKKNEHKENGDMASTWQERDCDGNRKTTDYHYKEERGIVMEMGMQAMSVREYGAGNGNSIECEGDGNGEGDGPHFENRKGWYG